MARWNPVKLRGPVKWHGGKGRMARKLIEHFPDDYETLVDVFGGAGNIVLNSDPKKAGVWADINRGLYCIFWMLSTAPERFIKELRQLSYEEAVFVRWRDAEVAEDDILQQALKTYVTSRMSRGGLGGSFAWSARTRGGKPGDLNAWETMLDHLPAVADRVRNIVLVNDTWEQLLCNFGLSPGVLFYCDPPYVPETRTANGTYEHEMTIEDHERFLRFATSGRFHPSVRFAISGYNCDLYRAYLDDKGGWRRVEFDMPNNSGQGRKKQRRTEVLWLRS